MIYKIALTILVIILSIMLRRFNKKNKKPTYPVLSQVEKNFFKAIGEGNIDELKRLFEEHKDVNPNI